MFFFKMLEINSHKNVLVYSKELSIEAAWYDDSQSIFFNIFEPVV